jgi:hypothetical protein
MVMVVLFVVVIEPSIARIDLSLPLGPVQRGDRRVYV